MSTIKLLDDDVINKIAAGEVVERPASVVKELTENAIDAGVRQIRIELVRGGKDLIIVSDDGHGIARQEIPLALTRHATSKIAVSDDLFRLDSMGFRGEALASIAAVSALTLSSKQADGTGWTAEGDFPSELTPWSGPVGGLPSGTTVVVKGLFSKIPARLNFLKSDGAEFGAVQEVLVQLALSNPQVGFTVSHNHKPVATWEGCADSSPDSFLKRCEQVLGVEGTKGLLPISAENRFVTVSGFVSPPGLEKSTGRHIFIFVNGRAVKDRNLRFALLRAYESHLLKGKSPVAVLNLKMDPALVDVNVHPAKTEVRFQYPLEVEGLLVKAIRTVLRSGAWAVPAETGAPGPFFSREAFAASSPSAGNPWTTSPLSMPSRSDFGLSPPVEALPMWGQRPTNSSFLPRTRGPEPTWQSAVATEERGTKPGDGPQVLWSEVQFIGTFSKLYLLFEWRDYLLVVDQHAFHERILFEKFLKDPQLLRSSQRLLVPEVIEVGGTEMATLLRVKDALLEWGYDLLPVAEHTVEVRAIPVLVKGRDLDALIHSLLGDGAGPGEEQAEIALHHLIATAACHSAVRAGEELTGPELGELLRQASSVDFYHNCPHGRRVLSWWTRNDVAKLFDRPTAAASQKFDGVGERLL